MQEQTKIWRESAAQQAARIIREWILNGRLPGGEYIRQETLAKELGVSRIPIRDALTMLEANGLIKRERNKGYLVTKLSIGEAKEAYALREMLEVYLLKKALPHISDEHIKHAEECIRKSKEATSETDRTQLNGEFHMSLYSAANMPLTIQTLKHVLQLLERYLKIQRTVSTSLQKASLEQHTELLAQIKSGSSAQAVNALKQHIQWNAGEISDAIAHTIKNK